MKGRARLRRLASIVAVTVAGALTVTAQAGGAVTCGYDQAAETLTATADANLDTTLIQVDGGGDRDRSRRDGEVT